MINMKVLNEDGKILVYLYNDRVDVDNLDELNDIIRKLFIKLIKRYHISLFGYNKVTIYHNSNYGLIIEIKNIYEFDYPKEIIDLKLVVYKNSTMYLEFDNYYFSSKPRNLIYENNKYYLNIDDINNINKYIEYGRIIIKKITK